MALPSLPVQGQNPWYTPRNDWDVAVKSELEGRLSETSLTSEIEGAVTSKAVLLSKSDAPTGTQPVTASSEMFKLPTSSPHDAFPGVTRLSDGRYFAAWRSSTGHMLTDGFVSFSTSEDGVNWGNPVVLSTSDIVGGGDIRDLGTSVDGATLLVTLYDGGTKRSYVKASSDDGDTWGPSNQLPFGWTDTAFISSPIAVTPSGAWIATAYGKDPGDPFWSVRSIRSTNKGTSWSSPVTVASGVDYYEPNAVSTGGSSILMLIRTAGRYIVKVTSSNDGVSWGPVSNAFLGQGNPHVTRLRSGVLVSTYRSLEGRSSPRFGYAESRTSRDNGSTWSRPVVFGHAPFDMAYADTVETDVDGELLCVWAAEQSLTSSSLYSLLLSDGSGLTNMGSVPSAYSPAPTAAQQYIRLNASSDQSVTPTTWTDIGFGDEVADLWDGYNAADSLAEFRVNEDGLYIVKCHLGLVAPGSGIIALWQAGDVIDRTPFPSQAEFLFTTVAYLYAANPYRMRVYMNAAATIRSGTPSERTNILIAKIKGA